MAALRCRSRGAAGRGLLAAWLLLGGALRLGAEARQASCVALSETLGQLKQGIWPPAYVFRSLQVRPGALHPPNLTRTSRSVALPGACDAQKFPATDFVWQKPGADGGEWVASTQARGLFLTVDEVPCPMTGIAFTTGGWPSMRLQFEECPRKTAVEVPLVQADGKGVKLVHWMCKVSNQVDPLLCAQAAANLVPQDPTKASPSQELLDLSMLAEAGSRGATRMQVYNDCYENLDWFIVNTPIGVEHGEFDMLLSLQKALAPSFRSNVHVQASVVVETVCTPNCEGKMLPECYRRDYSATPTGQVGVQEFMDTMGRPEVKPWAQGLVAVFFVIGALMAVGILRLLVAPAKLPERKIKSVAVSYHDVPNASHTFFGR